MLSENSLPIRSFTVAWAQPGRKKPLREFTLDRMLRETEKVYEEVVGDGG